MKHVQREALQRFTDRGFDDVTVEEIADAAEVSAMSVYRWFGTKEALVIWDEFDPPILASVTERLTQGHPPLAAVRGALVALLDEVYDRERDLALARTQLIHREPALLAAATANGRALRDALTPVFAAHGQMTATRARVAATIATALLETAVDAWQREDGQRPLAELITESFAAIKGLS
ncbi:MAG: TetR family transcriptional regulator [Actinobacteria bacterium]|nr:TetR family transcriptional regulator [Actinomycetota bacterium]